MLKVGLTGGIGSGKSTVSKLLTEIGIPIVDADIISREVYQIYPEITMKIMEEFGRTYFDEMGMLKRRDLGRLVFSNTEARLKLESLIMPYIKKEIFIRLGKYECDGEKICVVDAPTLIETGLNKEMNVNILVYADIDTQISRVINRDLLSKDEVLKRIDSQMPMDVKKEYVDFIIDNNGSIESTKEQLDKVLTQIY